MGVSSTTGTFVSQGLILNIFLKSLTSVNFELWRSY